MSSSSSSSKLKNIKVWDVNFKEEFTKFVSAAKDYPVIAVDTEFAGILENQRVYKKDEVYAQMKNNIDKAKCIQVGFALSKEDGELACREGVPVVWNFNLHFDTETDASCPDAMKVLEQSGGLDLPKHASDGIPGYKFGRAMVASGLLLTGDLAEYKTKWVTFHGNYDIGHLVSLFLPTHVLPNDREVFGDMMRSYFGENMHDVRLMGAYNGGLAYGKQKLSDYASRLNIDCRGELHQAGSDALITLELYHILRKCEMKVDCTNMLSDLFYGVPI